MVQRPHSSDEPLVDPAPEAAVAPDVTEPNEPTAPEAPAVTDAPEFSHAHDKPEPTDYKPFTW